ncbi:hypothetical protein GWK47_034607 [Chionoecetes opilio]|uniref:Uncharacterized protein n=1 Tax=Chionoecetes opilio TaxID=41210 RepID=A0A8J5CZV3_CHIOP|nr:hypothetical protein GWK47_034607 [Chionoecetes opilio]
MTGVLCAPEPEQIRPGGTLTHFPVNPSKFPPQPDPLSLSNPAQISFRGFLNPYKFGPFPVEETAYVIDATNRSTWDITAWGRRWQVSLLREGTQAMERLYHVEGGPQDTRGKLSWGTIPLHQELHQTSWGCVVDPGSGFDRHLEGGQWALDASLRVTILRRVSTCSTLDGSCGCMRPKCRPVMGVQSSHMMSSAQCHCHCWTKCRGG